MHGLGIFEGGGFGLGVIARRDALVGDIQAAANEKLLGLGEPTLSVDNDRGPKTNNARSIT